MPDPTGPVLKFARRHFPDAKAREAFLAAWSSGTSGRPALLRIRDIPAPGYPVLPPAPWQPGCVDSLPDEVRAGRLAEHASGEVYSLDLSSVFAARPLFDLPTGLERVIDVCASPGGKACLAWRALAPRSLVVNEAIPKRVAALTENLDRCRIAAEQVHNRDPAALADRYIEAADVVVVDAPCSGQSLPARGIDNPGCFHPMNVGMNAGRQRRILAESARMVRPGGWLLYSTCTYAPEENERNVRWLVEHFPDFQPQEVPALADHSGLDPERPSYRLWPQECFGAGAFTCLMRRSPSPVQGPEPSGEPLL